MIRAWSNKEKAPDFELPDQDGRPVKLSDFRGQPVVVYFYPKASTPGCTIQACSVRDHRADYEQANAVVLGISPTCRQGQEVPRERGAELRLAGDEGHHVADAYGVWVEKSMYGKTYFGNERTTFVIDPDGKVAQDPAQGQAGRARRARARGARPRKAASLLSTLSRLAVHVRRPARLLLGRASACSSCCGES